MEVAESKYFGRFSGMQLCRRRTGGRVCGAYHRGGGAGYPV